MEKRALIAVVLSLLVLVLYQQWVTEQYSPPPAPPAPESKQVEKVTPPAAQSPAALQQPQAVVQVPARQPAKDVRVETDYYVAVFTSLGARLKSFTFKRYRTSVSETSPPYEMIPAVSGVPFPLGLRWQAAAPFDDGAIAYAVEGSGLQLSSNAEGKLVFRGQLPDGSIVTKEFSFTGSSYPIQLAVSVQRPDANAARPELMLTAKSDHDVLNPDAPFEGMVALVDNKIKREYADALIEGVNFSGELSWTGFGYTYFIFSVLPENGAGRSVSVQRSGPALIMALGPQAGPAEPVARYTLFIGPKQLEILKTLGKDFEKTIDLGWFGFVALPFLYVMHFSHGFTGSYGIDIILLTILLKILMAPLTHKSFVSMKQMQKLAPQMERLKEKFKTDKEKLNKEIMELYRRNKVNPLGGCLPMLLQFPVFIGLYNALSTPIELRHAPFLWIKDLSRPDWESLPFTVGDWHLGIPVLTLLMGASMFLQQWMTPTAGDPNQRRMMLMMPIVFTAMFVTFPAGLTIYWLVNNVLTIGQQYWINRADR